MAGPNSTQASSFTCFSKLPREIQLSIWEYSLPPPRMVHISAQFLRFPSPYQRARGRARRLSRRPVPAILHASFDSRKVGLRHYELILERTTGLELSPTSSIKRKKPAYVDLTRDILVTKSHHDGIAFLEAMPETFLNRIRYFACSEATPATYGSLEFKELMKGLPALDGLAVIYSRLHGIENRDWWHMETGAYFTELKIDRETVPKIRLFGYEEDLEKALQNNKLWGAESEVGWVVSQVSNLQMRMWSPCTAYGHGAIGQDSFYCSVPRTRAQSRKHSINK